MADKGAKGDPAEYAKRIDPTKAGLSKEQLDFIRQIELAQWKKKLEKLRGRNIATGLFIGAITIGIYGYTFYAVSQERIMDEIDEEAKVARVRGSKTGGTN